jgi:alkylhydroperoxidase/carboxymuconolactone decarboxylase family protein YurZ
MTLPADAATTKGRYERGLDVYASQFLMPRDEVASWFAEWVGERFGEEAILSAAGAWVEDELSLRDRSLVVVAALIAQGGAEQQLRVHTRWAIEHGCTPRQLEALATLLGVYAGYPRASNGMMIVREELTKLEEP